jgi:hypothetical protein
MSASTTSNLYTANTRLVKFGRAEEENQLRQNVCTVAGAPAQEKRKESEGH